MRAIALAAALALSAGAAAHAQPADVQVAIGPKLMEKAQKEYGVRDVQRLADDLRADVTRELTRSGALSGARIELTLVDAKPNRPTFKQLGDKPGLSFQSFGLGGATIEGRAVAADGAVTPLNYSWYESDIRQAWATTTWSDANDAINRFAHRVARGQTLASR